MVRRHPRQIYEKEAPVILRVPLEAVIDQELTKLWVRLAVVDVRRSKAATGKVGQHVLDEGFGDLAEVLPLLH